MKHVCFYENGILRFEQNIQSFQNQSCCIPIKGATIMLPDQHDQVISYYYNVENIMYDFRTNIIAVVIRKILAFDNNYALQLPTEADQISQFNHWLSQHEELMLDAEIKFDAETTAKIEKFMFGAFNSGCEYIIKEVKEQLKPKHT